MRLRIDPAVVASNFVAFRDNPSLQESAQLFAQGRPVVEMIQAFATNPRVLSAFAGFDAVYPHGSLERGVLEKVILLVSHHNACQFCVTSHLDITAGLGIESEGADDPDAPVHTPRERLALRYARAIVTDANRVPASLHDALREQFRDDEIVELTFLVGFINMLNWFNNALEVRYHREFADVTVT